MCTLVVGLRHDHEHHTCVSRLIAEGAGIAEVQNVCGHSSAATTLAVYSHLSDNSRETAATKYDPTRGVLAAR